MQANFYLEKDLAQSMADDGPECELCTSATATHKCVQCQQLYCAPCRQTHDSIPSCNSHIVLPLGIQGIDARIEGKVETAQKNCPKHRGQVLILFCRQCEVSICIQCKLTSHDGHETEDVLDSGERAREELQKEVGGGWGWGLRAAPKYRGNNPSLQHLQRTSQSEPLVM